MSSETGFPVHLSLQTKQNLDCAARHLGLPRDSIIEYAVEEILQDLGYGTSGAENKRSASIEVYSRMKLSEASGGAPSQASDKHDQGEPKP